MCRLTNPSHIKSVNDVQRKRDQVIKRTDHPKILYSVVTTFFSLLRTYSIRICLQKLTESRIFTNAAFFISAGWHFALARYTENMALLDEGLEDVWLVFSGCACKSRLEIELAGWASVWWIYFSYGLAVDWFYLLYHKFFALFYLHNSLPTLSEYSLPAVGGPLD